MPSGIKNKNKNDNLKRKNASNISQKEGKDINITKLLK